MSDTAEHTVTMSPFRHRRPPPPPKALDHAPTMSPPRRFLPFPPLARVSRPAIPRLDLNKTRVADCVLPPLRAKTIPGQVEYRSQSLTPDTNPFLCLPLIASVRNKRLNSCRPFPSGECGLPKRQSPIQELATTVSAHETELACSTCHSTAEGTSDSPPPPSSVVGESAACLSAVRFETARAEIPEGAPDGPIAGGPVEEPLHEDEDKDSPLSFGWDGEFSARPAGQESALVTFPESVRRPCVSLEEIKSEVLIGCAELSMFGFSQKVVGHILAAVREQADPVTAARLLSKLRSAYLLARNGLPPESLEHFFS